MRLSDTDFDQQTRETLGHILEPEENILWCGKPGAKTPLEETLPILIFSLIWIAIPSFMVYMIIQDNGLDGCGAEICFPMLFILIGFILPILVFRRNKRQQQQSAYVLTEKRAVLLTPKLFSGTKVFTYPMAEDMLLSVSKKKDGSGNLVFDYSDVVVNGKPQPRGFLNLKDVETPLRLLKEHGVKAEKESFDF